MEQHHTPDAPDASSSSTTRWVTGAALQALAAQGLREGSVFTAAQLARWTRQAMQPNQRVNASTRLCALGLVVHKVEVIAGERADTYTVTADGAKAIEAAGAGVLRKSGPKGPTAARPLKRDTLAARLWQLLRMSQKLDSDTAAQTLCDPGQPFERVQATVRRTLRRWHQAAPDQVAEAVHRVGAQGHSNGCKRYVLLTDSPTPPRWRAPMAGKGAHKS